MALSQVTNCSPSIGQRVLCFGSLAPVLLWLGRLGPVATRSGSGDGGATPRFSNFHCKIKAPLPRSSYFQFIPLSVGVVHIRHGQVFRHARYQPVEGVRAGSNLRIGREHLNELPSACVHHGKAYAASAHMTANIGGAPLFPRWNLAACKEGCLSRSIPAAVTTMPARHRQRNDRSVRVIQRPPSRMASNQMGPCMRYIDRAQ
jgi:hypothetical protein